ncbi:MAG: TonB-dependent receptor, partial [Bacteroidetes bacterium]
GAHNARPPIDEVLKTESLDGETFQANANYGLPIGDKGGFINLTMDYTSRAHTNRPADPAKFDIYRRQFGDAAVDNFGTFFNAMVPVDEQTQVYAFGGFNFRHTDAYAWTRDPDSDRNVPAIYPNGFDPHITSNITDRSLSAGVRTEWKGWNVDFNTTYGSNRFHYIIDGTLNASLLEKSPTRFDAGGYQLSQQTTGLDFTRYYDNVLKGMNLAFGAEYRLENYEIFAGEEGSWRNYGIIDTVIDNRVVQVDVLGRPGGSQGFPGFQPSNELDEIRTNIGGYVDGEFDFTDRFMMGAALRFEHYSDFGNTLTGKLATRYELTDRIAVRASASTGFRAPSLAQIYFNTTFTDFVAGQPVDKIIAKNNSPITRELGIPPLKEETATNFSAGFTARFGSFTATVDGYMVDIKDRIVLTGAFEDSDPDIGDELRALGVGAAQFFTNALDTRTRGVDVILTWSQIVGDGRLRLSYAGNFNDMELGDIKTSDKLKGKEDIYFGSREQRFLLASAPKSKMSLTADYTVGNFTANLRLTRWGEVVLEDWIGTLDVYEPKITTDLTVAIDLNEHTTFRIGANNLFNVYPTTQDTETETGGLWDAVQMGSNGAFYFAKLGFKF